MADEDLTLVILRSIQTRLTGMETRLTGMEMRLTERIDVTNRRIDATNQLIDQRFNVIEHTLAGYGKHVASVGTFVVRTSKRLTPAVEDLQQRVSILEAR